MSIIAGDLIACAETLLSINPLAESSARAVVSRAYYGAFHDSKLWHAALPHQGLCPDEAKGTHNRLALSLQKPHGANEHGVRLMSTRRGILLRKLHGDRVKADYEIDDTVDAADAAQAVADAKVILSIN